MLLFTLLSTVCLLVCRVSIQHVNFHKPFSFKTTEHSSSAVDETRASTCLQDGVRVYPISSEGGYVIYHVGSTLLRQSIEDLSYDSVISGAECIHDEMMNANCLSATSHGIPIDTFGSRCSLDVNVTSSGEAAVPYVPTFSSDRRRHSDNGTLRLVVEHQNDDYDSSRHVSQSAESIVDRVIGDMIDSAVTRHLNAASGDNAENLASSGCESHRSCQNDESCGLNHEDGAALSETCARHSEGADYPSDVSNAAAPSSPGELSPTMHPLYAHVLLYVRKFDTNRAIYALGRLLAILATSPNVVVRALTTSNVGGASTPRAVLLQSLLVQHRRSVLGRRFHADDTESGASSLRSNMFIDVLVTVCLYYMRGYHPNLLAPLVTARDVADNARLQVSAADILTSMIDELAAITRTGGRGFATYICDLLDKCKVR